MFDGEIEHITAVFDAAYLNVVIDRFGENVRLTELEDDCFRADFQAAVSPTFLAWIIGFGAGALIISPQWVADEAKRLALEADKQRMLAGLSHDLKTPITIIQGFTKAIKDGLVSEEDKQKYLQIILTKSNQMAELINQFYEYNKLEHPDFALDKKPCDVAELARTFLANIYDEFEVQGYILDAQICEEPLVCNVDKGQLLRVFENLTGNFFKYTPQGSTLRFGVEREGNKARISLADNGPGINEESKADVFEAFVVGEKSRNKQGSGLGLAVCKKIVTMHGGNIELAKEPIENFTTEFVVTLDLLEGEEK